MNVESTLSPPRRGILFYTKRLLKWAGMLLLTILVAGVVYQAVASEVDRRNLIPPGQMVVVNGHRMHLYCTGGGGPTVILEAGAYSFSSEWYWVQRQLSATNRVCSYDRAGNGWSERVDGSRDGLPIVRELHDLLGAVGVESPYVFVGHSLGGVLAPIYAAQYPDEVSGLVLVDSAIPTAFTDYSQFEELKSANQLPYTIMSVLTRIGALRLILLSEFQSYGYPQQIIAQLTAFKATQAGVDLWDAEVRLAQWDLSRQFAAASDLGDLPVVVLWAGRPEMTAPEDRALLESIWAQMPTLSANTVVRVVDGANHGSIVGDEQYAQEITDATLAVIRAAQTGERLAE